MQTSIFMTKYFLPFVLLIFFGTTYLPAQNPYPKDDFRPPVDFKMALSGTFGELRTDHFHSGIDIKTWGVTGKPLHAVADGYVSRIAISGTGFGHAIYVSHPNGYTSVFGHCRNFRSDIDSLVKAEQYRRESFAVNIFPKPDQFPVKQGEVIAYSGNSGSSMGPHLHFEIRKSGEQVPVNPLAFGMPVKDYTRPTFQKIRIYPYGKYSFVDGRQRPIEYGTTGWGPDCGIQGGDTVQISGQVYFGVKAYDVLNGAKNHNGIYSMDMYVDSVLHYSHAMESFAFSESRYINSMIDYAVFADHGGRFIKTRIDPNNRLPVYGTVVNDGVVDFTDDSLHEVMLVISDFMQNKAVLRFWVQSHHPDFRQVMTSQVEDPSCLVFSWDRDNRFETDGLKLTVPAGALYDSIHFRCSRGDQPEGAVAGLYHVGRSETPLHTHATLSLQIDGIPSTLHDKALMVKVDDGDFIAAGGKWENGWLTAAIRSFGDYTVVTDTVPPEVKPLNIFQGKDVSAQSTIRFRIRDELSGIADYRATINGRWILMEYDPKNDLLFYRIDGHMPHGKNRFKLEVTDERGNRSVYSANLKR